MSPEDNPNGCNVRGEPGPPLPWLPRLPSRSRNWMRCDTPGFSPTFWDDLSLSWPERPLDRPGRLERFNCLAYRLRIFCLPLLFSQVEENDLPSRPRLSPLSPLNLLFVMAF